MTTEKQSSEKAAPAPRVTGVPVPQEEPTLQAGPGQTVVESPTGTKSVVDEDAVPFLKTQGYKAG